MFKGNLFWEKLVFDWIKERFKSDKSGDSDRELLSAKPIESIKLNEPIADEIVTELNVENRAIGFGKDNKPAPDSTEYDPNAKTMPQIWLDDEHIGGYPELEKRLNV